MATLASHMYQGAQANPQWVAANGAIYYINDPKRQQRTAVPGTPSTGNRLDYLRRVGRQGIRRGLGPIGWIVQVPVNAGWVVSLADDNSETALPSPPFVGKPPPGTSG